MTALEEWRARRRAVGLPTRCSEIQERWRHPHGAPKLPPRGGEEMYAALRHDGFWADEARRLVEDHLAAVSRRGTAAVAA